MCMVTSHQLSWDSRTQECFIGRIYNLKDNRTWKFGITIAKPFKEWKCLFGRTKQGYGQLTDY
jgi:hypothetical protein